MTTYTATEKRYGLNNMNRYAQNARLGDLVFGAAGGYPLDYPGKTYYVNNITGSASNDGLSWATAFAQPSTAITAVIAFQAAQATASLDIEARCRIYIAGTITAYTALTALASYCDYIGVGADPRGYGTGIARIGLDDLGVSGVIAASSTYRGVYFENIQFQMGSGYAFKVQNLYRSQFVNCAFMGDNTSAGGTTGFAAEKLSGVEFHHCHWGSAATAHAVCMDITGTHFHNCIMDDCVLDGTIGLRIAAGCTSGQGSLVTRSYLSSLDDNATTGKIVYANNFMLASGTLANNGAARYIGNYQTNGFSTVTAS
jgi:hypothetical protein